MKAILNKLILGLFRFLPCAFDATNMNRIQAGTTTLWIYKTTDAIATVAASGYFDDWYAQLNNGDTIIVADTNVPTIDMLTVTSASGATTVTTLNGT
jgi:hypothetical protein